MSDTCDPRKTGCDCYPFPHRRNSHPERMCFHQNYFNYTYPTPAWRAQVQAPSLNMQSAYTIAGVWNVYRTPLTGLVANKDIDVSIENGQLVLKQDE